MKTATADASLANVHTYKKKIDSEDPATCQALQKNLNVLFLIFPKTTIVQIVKLRQKDNWVILSKRMVVYDVTPEANPLRQFLLSRRCDNI